MRRAAAGALAWGAGIAAFDVAHLPAPVAVAVGVVTGAAFLIATRGTERIEP